ncbi:unnamed protein product [Candidula unifasciata]|uniref:Cell division cycle protein 123 homolog n=1 Tax=Candidula unifasciata TaxID=100452 RepID=A0A8S3YZ75_9EUPU|nr:unnamed protein product [Candidula unifasciata]
MKISDVLNCSFAAWYGTFQRVTFKSIVIPLPEDFVRYLHTDGIVLPDGSQCGLYTKSKNLAMDGDDDDEDLRDDDLMKKYENDWQVPSNTEIAKAPDFGELDETVKTAITSLGGKVFPKLNWSSPKDANWISFNRTLMCSCPSEVYLLLKSSEFIAHDLDQPFVHCDDYDSSSAADRNSMSYCLVLRQWQSIDPSCEFRCFVNKNRLIGICQRNSTKLYPHIVEEKVAILKDIVTFFEKEISSKFPDPDYVFDVVRNRKGKVILLDFNPWGRVTDSLMFTWDDLEHMAAGSQDSSCQQLPCFHCVESEDGVQCSDYGNYAFPKDIRDLTAGEDPFKLMDLMKLKIQSSGDGSSSSEDDY